MVLIRFRSEVFAADGLDTSHVEITAPNVSYVRQNVRQNVRQSASQNASQNVQSKGMPKRAVASEPKRVIWASTRAANAPIRAIIGESNRDVTNWSKWIKMGVKTCDTRVKMCELLQSEPQTRQNKQQARQKEKQWSMKHWRYLVGGHGVEGSPCSVQVLPGVPWC